MRLTRLLTVLFLAAFGPPALAGERLTVFAASSLSDVMAGIEAAWEAATGGDLTVALAGSSTLARQIEAGAPADVFVSASAAWMDRVAEAGLVVDGSRADIAMNRLVLVAPSRSAPQAVSAGDLPARLGDGRLAMALVDAVPAGIYGKQALTDLGLWNLVSDRVAQASDVRGALAMVALGAAPYGIVYATDAAAEPRVRVVAEFPPESHAAIRYPAAAIAGSDPEARAFVAYLRGPEARRILGDHGFGLPD